MENEQNELIGKSDVVLKAGIMMLGSGTSGLRVRELMESLARSLGLATLHTDITYTSITMTVGLGGVFHTRVAEVPRPGVNAHAISVLQDLGNSLPATISVDALKAKLKAIKETPALYPQWILVILVSLACASITVLNNGGLREVFAVVPASAIAFWLNRKLTSKNLNHLVVVMLSAAVAAGLYLGFYQLIYETIGIPNNRIEAGFISAAIFLIPGFPLITAGLDLTRVDLAAGIQRLTYAFLVLLSITIGIWIVSTVVGLSPDPVPQIQGNQTLWWIAMVLAGFFAVFGWAAMFNSPPVTAFASGVIAAVANVGRILLLQNDVSVHVATFFACFVMGLACAVAAKAFNLTKIIMTVPTILVVIPGSSALRTLLYFDQADLFSALLSGVSTVLVFIAMVAGLAGARMLTDHEWAFPNRQFKFDVE